MNRHIKPISIRAAYVVCIFTIGMVGLLLILDVILMPVLGELFRDSSEHAWCGVFSQCASGTQQSFLLYVWSGVPWMRLDITAIQERAKLAAISGVLTGIGFVAYLSFSSRR